MTDDATILALGQARDRLQAAILRRDLANERLDAAAAALRAQFGDLGRAVASGALIAVWEGFDQRLTDLHAADRAVKAARQEEYAAFKVWHATLRRGALTVDAGG